MKSIDRYMARLIAVPLFSTLVIAAMLLVLDRMLRLFDFVATAGGPVSVVWRMLANLLPEYLVSALNIPFYLGGTSLLIVVNVTMDTVTQIQSHLLAHQYGDLIKKSKLKGGRLR